MLSTDSFSYGSRLDLVWRASRSGSLGPADFGTCLEAVLARSDGTSLLAAAASALDRSEADQFYRDVFREASCGPPPVAGGILTPRSTVRLVGMPLAGRSSLLGRLCSGALPSFLGSFAPAPSRSRGSVYFPLLLDPASAVTLSPVDVRRMRDIASRVFLGDAPEDVAACLRSGPLARRWSPIEPSCSDDVRLLLGIAVLGRTGAREDTDDASRPVPPPAHVRFSEGVLEAARPAPWQEALRRLLVLALDRSYAIVSVGRAGALHDLAALRPDPATGSCLVQFILISAGNPVL
jgi:hypothetical protein